MGRGSLIAMMSGKTPPAGFSLVQSKTYGSTASASSHNVTYTSTPTAGNLLTLFILSDTTISSVGGSGWTQGELAVDFPGLYVYWKIAGGSEPTTLTANLSSIATCCLIALEHSGGLTIRDQHLGNTAQGPTTVTAGATGSTTAASELAFVVAGLSDGGEGTFPFFDLNSWTNGFTIVAQVKTTTSGTPLTLNVASKTLSTTGTVSSVGTVSATMVHGSSCTIAITFK